MARNVPTFLILFSNDYICRRMLVLQARSRGRDLLLASRFLWCAKRFGPYPRRGIWKWQTDTPLLRQDCVQSPCELDVVSHWVIPTDCASSSVKPRTEAIFADSSARAAHELIIIAIYCHHRCRWGQSSDSHYACIVIVSCVIALSFEIAASVQDTGSWIRIEIMTISTQN